MNRYKELKEKHQNEYDQLPICYAFDNEEFEKIMKKWKLDSEKDLDKITRTSGGGFIQKKDVNQLKTLIKKHNEEMQAAIDNDPDGTNFIYEMFYYQLCNHEFNYTRELDDVLYSLGYTLEDIKNDSKLKTGLKKATKTIINRID